MCSELIRIVSNLKANLTQKKKNFFQMSKFPWVVLKNYLNYFVHGNNDFSFLNSNIPSGKSCSLCYRFIRKKWSLICFNRISFDFHNRCVRVSPIFKRIFFPPVRCVQHLSDDLWYIAKPFKLWSKATTQSICHIAGYLNKCIGNSLSSEFYGLLKWKDDWQFV